MPALLGTPLLGIGFAKLAGGSGGSLCLLWAAGCGALLGLLSSALLDAARRARVAKRVQSGARPLHGTANRSREQWGVD